MARKISDGLLEELIHALMDVYDPRVEGRTSFPLVNIATAWVQPTMKADHKNNRQYQRSHEESRMEQRLS